jgi:16S rRNA (cytidine1402-2'-O)-methyltransferase
MPILYVVATPIGNLEDISLRALRTLREVRLIAAEDTRKTRRLLGTYDIKTPITSYYEHNKLSKLGYILEQLGEGDVAIVSEAGVPGISDPGYELIVAASRRGIPVVPIPGASAVTAALSVSGLATDRFTYIGFLPRKSGERRRMLESVASETGTIIALEAPHRLKQALEDILLVLGDRRVAICRQLTKMHEETFRGTVIQAMEHFAEPKGEFTLVIEGCGDKDKPQLTPEVERQLEEMHHSGMTAKEAVSGLAEQAGLPKKELYRAWLRLS